MGHIPVKFGEVGCHNLEIKDKIMQAFLGRIETCRTTVERILKF